MDLLASTDPRSAISKFHADFVGPAPMIQNMLASYVGDSVGNRAEIAAGLTCVIWLLPTLLVKVGVG